MGEMVAYRSNGGTSGGYLALPSTGAPSPAVVVIQERWGLTPHITGVVDRFAAAGFVALAPDLSHAEGPLESGNVAGQAMDRAADEVAAIADYLAGRPEVTGGVGCVGFRAGGSLALWAGTRTDRIVTTAGFYPVLPWNEMRPEWSDYAGKTAVVHCSEEDGSSTAEGTQAARAAIEAAGGQCTLYDYPGTSHSFFNDDLPEVYHQQAAASAWARTLEILRARLG